MKNLFQFKIYFLLLLLLCNKYIYAQYGDAYHSKNTFALEQARQSRMQQNDDAHRAKMNSPNGINSNRGSGTYGSADLSWLNRWGKKKEYVETAEAKASRLKLEAEIKKEQERKEAEQKVKDDAWKKELNKLSVARTVAEDKANSFNTRYEANQFLYNYIDSINNAVRQNSIRTSSAKNAPFASQETQYCRYGNLYLEYKIYDKAYSYFDMAYKTRETNPISKKEWLWNYSYYLNSLLYNGTNYEFNVLQTSRAYVYNDNKINAFAYALFLNNELNNACSAYWHFMNNNPKNITDSVKTVLLTRIVAMNLINGNNAEALDIVHKNFDDTIQNVEKVKSIISGMLATEIEFLESKKYTIPSFSTLFDLDLLCKLYPDDIEANKLRMEYGKTFGNLDRQKNINNLWTNLPKKNYQISFEDHLTRGREDGLLQEAIDKLGTSKKVPLLKNYELPLRDINAYLKREFSSTYHSFAVKDGYLIIYNKAYRPYYIKIEDFKGIYYTYDDKDLKLYGSFYNAHTEESETEKYIFREKNTQNINQFKELLERLFKELKKKK